MEDSKTKFFCEAHDALSAKIVSETGFDGIWLSGLTTSASYGLKDLNEISVTDLCHTLEKIKRGADLPVLVDIDNGYGDYNNAASAALRLENFGASGVCIEDKAFPKKNSFSDSSYQKMEPANLVSDKIDAIKNSQMSKEFFVVARIESFVCGESAGEALERAHAYLEAGADKILIHSSRKDYNEIESFLIQWEKYAPIVLVPTTYTSAGASFFEKYDIDTVVWANQMTRGAISHMKVIAQDLYKNKNSLSVEDKIASVKEIFRLQGMDEYNVMREKYGY